MGVPQELQLIADQMRRGEKPSPQSTRTFLRWFGASRRGYIIVQRIRGDLNALGIETVPDFEDAYIDALLEFRPIATSAERAGGMRATREDRVPLYRAEVTPPTQEYNDPTYRLSRLKAANNKPVYVATSAPLEEAITKMLVHDFSQLPVMTGDSEVKGALSWRSVGKRLALKVAAATVDEAMDPCAIVDHDMSIFDAIQVIVEADFALVRAADGTIAGIVTTSDLGSEFGRLGEPFLVLGEIENHLRWLLNTRFSVADLKEAAGKGNHAKNIEGPEDLSLGAIQYFLNTEPHWKTLGLPLDRDTFIAALNEVRRIRNDAMHFDPDGVLPDEVERLRDFVRFLRSLHSIGWQ